MTSTFPGVGQGVWGVKGTPVAARPHCTPTVPLRQPRPCSGPQFLSLYHELASVLTLGFSFAEVGGHQETQEGAWVDRAGRPYTQVVYKHLTVSTRGRAHPPHGGPVWTHLWMHCR